MKKTIISIIGLVLVYFAVDRVGGCIMDCVWEHSYADTKLKDVIYSKHDLVFLGSSKTESQYVPSIIEDTLKMDVYNGGFVACKDVYYQYAILNLILKNYTPKIIVLETNDCLEDKTYRLQALAPFIGQDECVDSTFKDRNMYNEYMLSHMYRYNSGFISTVAGLFHGVSTDPNKGYVPAARANFTMKKLVQNEFEKCEMSIRYLQKIVDTCKHYNIRLIFCAGPYYAETSPTLLAHIDSIAQKNDISFLDYHTTGLYTDTPKYWYDNIHLCDEGARLYSSRVAHDIKTLTK